MLRIRIDSICDTSARCDERAGGLCLDALISSGVSLNLRAQGFRCARENMHTVDTVGHVKFSCGS